MLSVEFYVHYILFVFEPAKKYSFIVSAIYDTQKQLCLRKRLFTFTPFAFTSFAFTPFTFTPVCSTHEGVNDNFTLREGDSNE